MSNRQIDNWSAGLRHLRAARLPFCSFCGLGDGEVARLFEGCDEDYICDECVVVCSQFLSDLVELGLYDSPTIIERPSWLRRLFGGGEATLVRCDFCHLPQLEGQRLLAGPEVRICERCIRACNTIQEGRGLVV